MDYGDSEDDEVSSVQTGGDWVPIQPQMTYFELRQTYLFQTGAPAPGSHGFTRSTPTSTIPMPHIPANAADAASVMSSSPYTKSVSPLLKPHDPAAALPSSPPIEDNFRKIRFSDVHPSKLRDEDAAAPLEMIREAIQMRSVYVDDTWRVQENAFVDTSDSCPDFFDAKLPKGTDHQLKMFKGVMRVSTIDPETGETFNLHSGVPSVEQFYQDLDHLMHIVTNGPCKTLAFQRLQLLEAKFKIHCMLNGDMELRQQKAVAHRDFYNIRKVDNHVHHSACMNQKHLLRFIKRKLKSNGDVKNFMSLFQKLIFFRIL
jgi:hypothetical protein